MKNILYKSSQDPSKITSTRKASYTASNRILEDHRDMHLIDPFTSVKELIEFD